MKVGILSDKWFIL